MIQLDYLVNDPAKLTKYLLFILAMATPVDEPRSATHKTLVLFGPFDYFDAT